MVSARPRTARSARSARTRREKANARERSRMHGQNAVLMRLLRCLPLSSERGGAAHKISKIEILRLAINYLCVLQRLLLEGEDPVDALCLPVLLASLAPGLSRATASRLDAHRLTTPPTPAPAPWGPWDV